MIITVGVMYNSARIGLQERAWELASLRVLGFTRAEVCAHPVRGVHGRNRLGIPLGLIVSQGIVALIARFHSNESFQIPAVIGPRTYAASAIVVLAAAAASAFVVRRRIDRLDLVARSEDEGLTMRITIGRVVAVLGLMAAVAGIVWSVMPRPDSGRDGNGDQRTFRRQR